MEFSEALRQAGDEVMVAPSKPPRGPLHLLPEALKKPRADPLTPLAREHQQSVKGGTQVAPPPPQDPPPRLAVDQ